VVAEWSQRNNVDSRCTFVQRRHGRCDGFFQVLEVRVRLTGLGALCAAEFERLAR
jgi:hypothetical protein